MDAENPQEPVITLMGYTGGPLTSIEELDPAIADCEAAMEGLDIELESKVGKPLVNEPGNDRKNPDEKPPTPCYISRYVNADGSALVRIYMLGTFLRYANCYVAILDSASDKDVIEITIDTEAIGPEACFAMGYRSLLSAIHRCKAKVITKAGTLMSVARVALWLSGDEVQISPIGWIRMEQLPFATGGFLIDGEDNLKEAKETWNEFSNYIAEQGLCTLEEMTEMYTNRKILSYYGHDLQEAVARVNARKRGAVA